MSNDVNTILSVALVMVSLGLLIVVVLVHRNFRALIGTMSFRRSGPRRRITREVSDIDLDEQPSSPKGADGISSEPASPTSRAALKDNSEYFARGATSTRT